MSVSNRIRDDTASAPCLIRTRSSTSGMSVQSKAPKKDLSDTAKKII